jgi:hypothetical protein
VREYVFQASGPEFHPRSLSLGFIDAFDPGEVATFGPHAGSPAPLGSARYAPPDDRRGTGSALEAFTEYLAEIQPQLRAAGATAFILHVTRTFTGVCREELTRRELQAIARLDCHLFYSASPEIPSGDAPVGIVAKAIGNCGFSGR